MIWCLSSVFWEVSSQHDSPPFVPSGLRNVLLKFLLASLYYLVAPHANEWKVLNPHENNVTPFNYHKDRKSKGTSVFRVYSSLQIKSLTYLPVVCKPQRNLTFSSRCLTLHLVSEFNLNSKDI